MLFSSGRSFRSLACALVGAALLFGCGGGDSAAPSLSGVAAVGDPIVGGAISVKCAGGSALNTSTSSTGAWQVEFSGQTLPCAVQVTGGTVGGVANTTSYHSVALTLGTVNVTPLTDILIAQLTKASPLTWFGSPVFTGVDATTVAAALNSVKTSLGLASALGSIDPLTVTFKAQNGDTVDNILEAFKLALANLSKTYADLLAAAQLGDYTAFSGFGAAFTTAYGSVGGSSACGAGQTLAAYSGTTGLYTTGQKVCFGASATELAFSGKTLSNPVQNTMVTAPYSAYTFTDNDGYTYEVVFNDSALYEINVSNGGTFEGQFVPAVTGSGSLTVDVSIGGVPATSVVIPGVPAPQNQTEFCSGIQNDSNLTALAANGASLTINSCTFSGNVGHVAATVVTTVPISLSVAYDVTYTYAP